MTWLPLDDLPLAWRIYTIVTYAAAFLLILVNVLVILPEIACESWDWIHEALARPDVSRDQRDRARLNVLIRISDFRKGARL